MFRVGSVSVHGRYAKALFSVAMQERCIEEVLHDLMDVKGVLFYPNLQQVLFSPLFSFEEKTEIVGRIVGKPFKSIVMTSFLNLLGQEKRWDIFMSFFEDFRQLVDDLKQIKRVFVTSASPLDSLEKDETKRFLKQWFKKEVDVQFATDPNLLGGYMMEYDGMRMDLSVRRYLNDVASEMKGTALR